MGEKGQRFVQAMICTVQRKDESDWEKAIAVGHIGRGPSVPEKVHDGSRRTHAAPLAEMILVDLDGKIIESPHAVRLQFYSGVLIARENEQTDGGMVGAIPGAIRQEEEISGSASFFQKVFDKAQPEEWPKPQDLAGEPGQLEVIDLGIRSQRHSDFVTVVQTLMLQVFDARIRGAAATVVAHAMALKTPPPADGDLLEQAEAFARYWSHDGPKPEWLDQGDEIF